MRRRDLLAGFAATTTGCLGPFRLTDENPPASTHSNGNQLVTPDQPTIDGIHSNCQGWEETGTNAPDSVRKPDIAVGIDEPGNDVHLAVEITRQFTDHSPAEMRVVIGNNSDITRSFAYGPRPLSHGSHTTTDASLMADWRSSGSVVHDSAGCWRANTELIGQPILMKEVLSPGDAIVESYTLLVPEGSEQCMPNGTYEFSATIEVGPSMKISTVTEVEWALCLD